MVSFVSWNVNSVNKRLPNMLRFISEFNPDVIMLQELKCIDSMFPGEELKNLGYKMIINGQKAYNGVAIISKHEIVQISNQLHDKCSEARYLECVISVNDVNFVCINVYVPQGRAVDSPSFQEKLVFLKKLKERFSELQEDGQNIIAGGDYNVAVDELDVFSTKVYEKRVSFLPEERAAMHNILNDGMCDTYRLLHPNTKSFSWWDYRQNSFTYDKGIRIDYLLTSANISSLLSEAGIYRAERGLSNPSDHAPIFLELKDDFQIFHNINQ